ncbi:hypothetical protein SDRG_04976 [Saprolegnia diclina VS20]|uniref:Phosducin domain-containing protein n=1 Tax=Saprolegnia diclina (strain VS20) TaxID=1156394 RepID=T0QJ09_SAPDV|nr:hypothetical protein SDRG_04976 [Saprolegnia diclina VS20]EQC37959.1 hypothetical protein SDRG_04976 [Saprolegnia diclina VS20]|eukprot:XP_008608892.1 hypothetical protein SDRG_04976 [Saprolegnia diclina VS20]
MDDFFLRHDVYKDRDADELGGKVNSDSEASDEEPSLPASAADPTGPWSQAKYARQGKRRTFTPATHTGPKGVLTDYRAYKQAKAAERRQNEAVRTAVMNRIAKGHTVPAVAANNPTGLSDNDSDADLSDLSDDEMMKEYCAKRMLEMTMAERDGRPAFGTLQYSDPFGFVDTVDAADARVHVIVHMCDERNQVCVAINHCLEQLCLAYVHTQFLVVDAKQADATFDASDLPIFMVYKGGAQVESLVHVFKQLQGTISTERLASLLSPYLG